MACGISCLKNPTNLSSEDEDTFYDLETRRMILKEIRSQARSKSNEFFYSSNFSFSFSSSASKKKKHKEETLDVEENIDNEDESEAFFSVNSNFSHCPSHSATGSWDEIKVQRSVLEEFKDCEGWPFGLYRRCSSVRLPPLPSTPADSWMWRKRNDFAVKSTTCSAN